MAVLLSVRPKWCELIASGKKTVEIRKTRPKIETPFKCYIYCTKPKMITKYVFKPEGGAQCFSGMYIQIKQYSHCLHESI